jgi:thiosulfate dehydrogenase [quinone] large subunit
MATLHRHHVTTESSVAAGDQTVGSTNHSALPKALAALRIAFGVTFLWAFFDKLLALGFHTGAVTNEAGARTGIDFFAKDGAWLNGGSPTEGFLAFGVPAHNPFKGTFNSMAGDAWVDVLFMAGLLGIGIALTFGIGMRIGAAAGALMYLFMYAASLPLENNPVFDDHLIGAISMVVLGLALAGDTWGFGKIWARTSLVKNNEFLR